MAEALSSKRDFERHKQRVRNAKPTQPADQAMDMVDDLIQGFQHKKSLRTTFKTRNTDVEIQAEHLRMLKQLVDIDRGKRLSVGPAGFKPLMTDDLHSLNFGNKVREYSRIDQDNEKLMVRLKAAPTSVQSITNLME